jgi:hypothetical protein
MINKVKIRLNIIVTVGNALQNIGNSPIFFIDLFVFSNNKKIMPIFSK